jgi:integrase
MQIIESNPALLAPVPETPAWGRIRSLVVDAVASPHTKRLYGHALDEFLAWYRREQPGPLSKAVVQRYKATVLEAHGLAASSINAHLAVLRKLAAEAADNGLLDAEVARAIGKVRGARTHGVRLGTWLSREEAQALLDAPDRTTLRGLRDAALFAVLLGAGLRRTEAASLRVEHLQQREGRWVIVDLLGKGGRVRSVPIAPWVKAAIDRWLTAAGIHEGFVVRPVNKGGNVGGERMTDAGVYAVLKNYAELAPHDLRRTYAQLARKANA